MVNKKQSDDFLFEILKMKTNCDNIDDFKLFTEKYNKIKDLVELDDVIDEVVYNKGLGFVYVTEKLDTFEEKDKYIDSFNLWIDSLDRIDLLQHAYNKLKDMQSDGEKKYNGIDIDILCKEITSFNQTKKGVRDLLKGCNFDEIIDKIVTNNPEIKTPLYKEYENNNDDNYMHEKELATLLVAGISILNPQKYIGHDGGLVVRKSQITIKELLEKIDFLKEHLDLDTIKSNVVNVIGKYSGVDCENDIDLDDWNHSICKYAGKNIYDVAIDNFKEMIDFIDIGGDIKYKKSDLNLLIKDLEDRQEKFINDDKYLYDKFNDEYLDNLPRFHYLDLMKKAEENCNVIKKHKIDNLTKPKTPKI